MVVMVDGNKKRNGHVCCICRFPEKMNTVKIASPLAMTIFRKSIFAYITTSLYSKKQCIDNS